MKGHHISTHRMWEAVGETGVRVANRTARQLERLEDRAPVAGRAARAVERLARGIEQITPGLTSSAETELPKFGYDAEGFRQLWPFLPGVGERLAAAERRGLLSGDEAKMIADFSENGYVVFPGAIPGELCDRLVADVRSIKSYPGCFVTTDHRNGRAQTFSGPDFDDYESIFDTYVNFESARQICLHPTITRFLSLVFQTPPIAMQQLLFQRSNQHPIHQDTSVVCTEDPLLLIASWIALEDVVKGRGELTYYEGSHRIAHYRFSDGTKRFNPKVDDPEAVRSHIHTECERLGCPKRDFIARKGDVLLWAADLAHGSNPRTEPVTHTRMSLVTHYMPETTEPFWFRFYPKNRTFQEYRDRAKYASVYYRLPTTGEITAPKHEIP